MLTVPDVRRECEELVLELSEFAVPLDPRTPLSPDQLPDEAAWLTFPEWLRMVGHTLRDLGSSGATWLAGEVDQLADLADAVGATTPEDLDARREVLDEGHDDAIRQEARSGAFALFCRDEIPLW
jgi:hypothetical protein